MAVMVEGRVRYGLFAEGAAFTFFGDLGEEVVALVVYEDKCGEVFDLDFPDGFHAEFGVFEELDFLDGVLREHCGGAADAAQIESAVLMTRIGDLPGAVSFGNHDHRAAGGLELVDVAVHASGGGGAEAARGHTLRRLGRAGVVYGMAFEVLRHGFAAVEAFLDFGVGDVATYDDGAAQGQACRYGIFGELGKYFRHGSVEVDIDDLAFAGLTHFFGDEFAGVGIEFLDPEALAVDFGFDVAVGAAAYAEAYGA